MADPFIGEIKLVSFDYAPKGWALCQGQVLAINQNQALFSLLGTTYGGNGVTTFQLPNLQGRVAVHASQNFSLGEQTGASSVTLAIGELPSHSHPLRVSSKAGTTSITIGATPAVTPTAFGYAYGDFGPSPGAESINAIATSGGNQPHDNMMPYLALNYVIALVGIFPSRN